MTMNLNKKGLSEITSSMLNKANDNNKNIHNSGKQSGNNNISNSNRKNKVKNKKYEFGPKRRTNSRPVTDGTLEPNEKS